jgi:hypothetical protein
MAELPAITIEPWTGAEIIDQTNRVHRESVAYWAQYSTDTFFKRPSPDVWAPADQIRHLTKSMRAVTNGLKRSRLLLWFKFGRADRPSMTCAKLSAWYEELLLGRPSAGRFSPSPVEASQMNDAGRDRIMKYHEFAVADHNWGLASWTEAALDRYRLLHPVMGKLSLREFGFFTLLHNVHHVHVAEGHRAQKG